MRQEHYDNFDSLDANVLNDSYEAAAAAGKRGQERGDLLHSTSYHR